MLMENLVSWPMNDNKTRHQATQFASLWLNQEANHSIRGDDNFSVDGKTHPLCSAAPATTCDCHERTFCYVGISSTGP